MSALRRLADRYPITAYVLAPAVLALVLMVLMYLVLPRPAEPLCPTLGPIRPNACGCELPR